ncbi:hypothetical protein [Comamonas sp. SCN 65-56]|uniref:hypothetical protein n=1 Tax=Comamonas sp. SCN 65-56 TaxID=1660095 RepID=UPI0025BA86C7|nr:hypothetical protein [Comamonas sp. SCN 65-56]
MRPQLVCAMVLLAAMALAGCNRPPPDAESYFPLHLGARWTYALRTDMAKPPVEATLELSVVRKETLEGEPVTVRRSASGVEYYVRENASGLERVASRTDLEELPLRDETPIRILPARLQPGVEWIGSTAPVVLQRTLEFPHELKYEYRAHMVYRIAAIDETLEVPAGRFSPCVRVEGSGSFKIYKDGLTGVADQTIASTEWYCKGVGLARFDRDEPADSRMLKGGKVSYVLTEYAP